jgi:hypothetical protein
MFKVFDKLDGMEQPNHQLQHLSSSVQLVLCKELRVFQSTGEEFAALHQTGGTT